MINDPEPGASEGTHPVKTILVVAGKEQTPVHLEHLPAWKQLIMESRQVQTVSMHLMAESKRQRAALRQQVTELRQQRWVLFDR